MIRTGDEYRESIRDGREVWINGERVARRHRPTRRSSRSSTSAPASTTWPTTTATRDVDDLRRPRDRRAQRRRAASCRARARTGTPSGARSTPCSTTSAASSPASATRRSARCGRSTTARTCSTRSTRASPRTSAATSSARVRADPFHVSANTDPKGDRSKRPQDQDPDMLLHVVRETDRGIVVRGAKYETAAAYANQAFVKPTIANWGDGELSDYAVGFIVDMGAPGLKHICRTGFAGRAPGRGLPALQPLRRGRHAGRSSTTSRSRGRTCSSTATPAPPPTSGPRCTATAPSRSSSASLRIADLLIGAALFNVAPDRAGEAAGGAGEAGRARLLPRGHQRPPDGGDRRWPRRAPAAC